MSVAKEKRQEVAKQIRIIKVEPDKESEQKQTAIYAKMKEMSKDHIGTPIRKTVMTALAHLNHNQRQATENAKQPPTSMPPGLSTSPRPKALAFAMDKTENKAIPAFDPNGGTFNTPNF